MSVSHVLYGLRVAANFALPGLPSHERLEAVDVRIWLKNNSRLLALSFDSPEEFFYVGVKCGTDGGPALRVGMLAGGEYYGFFYRDGARFAMERQGREVWADWPDGYTLEDACTYLLGPVMGFVLRLRGITCLHASAVAVDDYAIALVGFPGAGKSTLAAAFARHGFPVLSDDVVALADEGRHFLVQPGYPRVNLWPDSVQSLFGSQEALPRITPTWDKRYMALGENGLSFASKPLPLGAVYVLGARETALIEPVIEEVAGADAFTLLVANTYVNYLLDRDMRSQEFDVLGRVVGGVPIRRTRPTTKASALPDLCDAILADVTRLTPAAESLTNIPYR